MTLLKRILGGKNQDKIIDTALGAVKGVGKWIDERKFTDEEAAVFNQGVAKASADFVKDTLSENTERSKTRRTIAIDYTRFFCLLVVGIIIIKIVENYAPKIAGAAEFAQQVVIQFNLHWAFIAVIGFFFGVHTLRSYQGSKKK